METENENELKWKIEEPDLTPKNAEWLWAFGILALAIVVFSILLKNYLLIIIVALAALIIFGGKNKKSELVDFHLGDTGLRIERKFYPYENFESFWIFPEQSDGNMNKSRELVLRYKRHVMPLLIVPFFNDDEFQIKNVLKKHLTEKEERESLLDLLRKRYF